MSPEQRAAVAHLSAVYTAQRRDYLEGARRHPGEGDAEYAAAAARYAARHAPDGEIAAGWRWLYEAYDHHPPEAIIAAIEARFWGPAPAEQEVRDAA